MTGVDLDGLEAAGSWAPSLFAWLWTRLERSASTIVSTGYETLLREEVGVVEGRLRVGLPDDGAVPEETMAYLREPANSGIDPLRRAYIVAKALDHLLGGLLGSEYATAVLPKGLSRIRAHYRVAGCFSRPGEPLVLPRDPSGKLPPPEPASGDVLWSQFRFVIAVPLDRSNRCRFTRLAARNDIPPDELEGVRRVGVVPLAEHSSDVTVSLFEYNRDPRIQIIHTPAQEGALAGRAVRAIEILEEHGVQIGVFPEWVVSPGVAQAIGERLARLYVEGHGRTHLQLVVAGSGLTTDCDAESKLPYNECTVFSRTGRVLWRQRKMHHYLMGGDVLSACGLGSGAGRRREHFHSGSVLEVVDSNVGRMTVLICEDLTQNVPERDIMEYFRPQLVFAPVLDRSLAIGRWAGEEASELARDYGTDVVVSNSLVLSSLDATTSGVEAGIGLLISGRLPGRFMLLESPSRPPSLAVRFADWAPDAWPKRWVEKKDLS